MRIMPAWQWERRLRSKTGIGSTINFLGVWIIQPVNKTDKHNRNSKKDKQENANLSCLSFFYMNIFQRKIKRKNIVFLGIGIEYELYGAFVLR